MAAAFVGAAAFGAAAVAPPHRGAAAVGVPAARRAVAAARTRRVAGAAAGGVGRRGGVTMETLVWAPVGPASAVSVGATPFEAVGLALTLIATVRLGGGREARGWAGLRGGGGASSECRWKAARVGTARHASASVPGALVTSRLPFRCADTYPVRWMCRLGILFGALPSLHPLLRARPPPPTTPQDDGEIYCVSGKVPPTGLPLAGADVDAEVR